MLSRSQFGYLALLLTVAVGGCDRVQLLAPTSSTITISADARTLPIGGSTQLTAVVMESGGTQVQNGTFVRFSTTLGRVDPVEAQTRGGIAYTTFFAGDTSGVADVRATSGGATGGGSSATPGTANVTQIQVGAAAATGLALSTSSSTLPATGGSVSVTALVLDGSGNNIRNAPVSFTTNVGTLSTSSVSTNESGQASVVLTTNRSATVTARVGSGEGTRTATVTIVVPIANSLVLATAPAAPTAGQVVTLTVTPSIGANNVAPHVVVSWGDGAQSDLGIVAAARTASHVYTSSGTFTIVATGTVEGEITTASTALTVNPPAAIAVTLAVSATPTKCALVTFTATVTGDATASIRSYEWRVDGTAVATTTGNTLTRVFSTAGIKLVEVIVTTTDGRTGNGQAQINVAEGTLPSC